ncbi:type VII secretion target [Mycobacterium sp. NPDC003323]
MTTPGGPSDELRVTPSHLRDLASKHGDAATQIAQATHLTDGIDAAILRTHGTACSSAAAAASRVAEARKRACIALETTSQAHEANLGTAADLYTGTDAQGRAAIDGQIPGQPR